MAINQTMLDTSSDELSAQIGRMFSGIYHRLRRKPSTIALAESFDIWNLSTKNLQHAIETGKLPAYKTRYQHHQIRFGNYAKAFALSRKLPLGKHRILKVGLSKVAEQIDKAITVLDKEDKSDARVRLLVVHPLRIYAFWLVDKGLLYLISVPFRLKGLLDEPYISAKEFLQVSNKEIERFKSDAGKTRHDRGVL